MTSGFWSCGYWSCLIFLFLLMDSLLAFSSELSFRFWFDSFRFESMVRSELFDASKIDGNNKPEIDG